MQNSIASQEQINFEGIKNNIKYDPSLEDDSPEVKVITEDLENKSFSNIFAEKIIERMKTIN